MNLQNEIEKNIIDSVTTLSVDLFDTLLFRNTKPEIYRFHEVSILHYDYFIKNNIHKDVDTLFCARLLAQKTAYKTAPIVDKCRDASLEHILSLYLVSLQLPPTESTIDDLISIEIAYEKNNLYINDQLLKSIKYFIGRKKKIYVISDMYFHKEHILELLHYFQVEQFITDVYVSSQYSVSKICGELFTVFLKKEKLQQNQVVHIGDNYLADKLMPVSKGISAVYISQPFIKSLSQKARKIIYHLKYRNFLP